MEMVTDSSQCLTLGNTMNPQTLLVRVKEACLLQTLAASRARDGSWEVPCAPANGLNEDSKCKWDRFRS